MSPKIGSSAPLLIFGSDQ